MRAKRHSAASTRVITTDNTATDSVPAAAPTPIAPNQTITIPAHQPPTIENRYTPGSTQAPASAAPIPNIAQPAAAPYQEQVEPNLQNAENPNSPDSAFQESELFPGQFKPIPEETIFTWVASTRPFKRRNRQFYTTVGMITMLISLILFLAGQLLPIAVVLSVAFLGYVMSSVPPDQVENKITTHGIRHHDAIYYWDEMGRFWFDQKFGQGMVQIEISKFPGRLTLMFQSQKKAELKELLSEVLLNERPKDTFYEKSASWLQEKIPLEAPV
jgi:hypothetical protein